MPQSLTQPKKKKRLSALPTPPVNDSETPTLRSAQLRLCGPVMTRKEQLIALTENLPDNEVAKIIAFVTQLRSAQDDFADRELVTRVVATLYRHAGAFRLSPGVPLPILRAKHKNDPPSAIDRALYAAEREGYIRLLPASQYGGWIRPSAGIRDCKRGLLYYCAPPKKSA